MKKIIIILFLIIPINSYASKIQKIEIIQHNSLRSEVMSKPHQMIQSNASLEEDAQNWANYLANNYSKSDRASSPHSHRFETQKHDYSAIGQGENIARGYPKMDISKAITLWGNEKEKYDLGNCSLSDCGHYTQIVWAKSTMVGCAQAKSKIGYGEWVVCRYSPAGNYIGENPYTNKTSVDNTYAQLYSTIVQLDSMGNTYKKYNSQLEVFFIKLDVEHDKKLLEKIISKFEKKYIYYSKSKNTSIKGLLIQILYLRAQLELEK